jgi:hypothetical protein
MDRRNFIKTLLASGVLGSSPLAARAASELFTPGEALPMMIIGQSGLPHADELVARLRQVLVAAGIEHVYAEATGSELAEYSHVCALLDRIPGKRVIGVMDDAAALIFQELAAVRGAACVVNTHHRFAAQEVRHCCTSAGLAASIVWSDSLPDHAERISRLYAGTLGRREPAVDRGARVVSEDPARVADGTPGSLVSFLITL